MHISLLACTALKKVSQHSVQSFRLNYEIKLQCWMKGDIVFMRVQSLVGLYSAPCEREYEWNFLHTTHVNTLIGILSYVEEGQ